MKTQEIVYDHEKANTVSRKQTIEFLKENGFQEAGSYSCSGEMRLIEMDNGTGQIVFGKRCNNGSRNGFPKYFSLKKSFKSFQEAKANFNTYKLLLHLK